jgi:hypothetical protein
MSLVIAAADAEAAVDGMVLGAAVLVAAGLGVDAAVGAALDDPVEEHAAIAMASAGTRRTTDRFMSDDFPSGSGWFVVGPGGATSAVFSTKSILSSQP